MAKLPGEDRNRIDADHDETYIEPIAEILYQRDRPWFTKDQLKFRLKEEHNINISKPTITDRLNDLIDKELVRLRIIGGTHVYYYNSDKSEWPIPPDTVVETDGLTISELFNKNYIWWAATAVFAVLSGGIIVWVGTLQASDILTLPFSSSDVLAIGLLVFLCSYLLLLVSIIIGFLDMVIEAEPPDILT